MGSCLLQLAGDAVPDALQDAAGPGHTADSYSNCHPSIKSKFSDLFLQPVLPTICRYNQEDVALHVLVCRESLAKAKFCNC